MVDEETICDRCLGRSSYQPGADPWTNLERGTWIRTHPFGGFCVLCLNLFSNLPSILARIITAIEGWEGSTFLIGVEHRQLLDQREQTLWGREMLEDSISREIRRTLGCMVETQTQLRCDFEQPVLWIMVDPMTQEIKIHSRSICIRSRYQKLNRLMYQSPFVCPSCRGRDRSCSRCHLDGTELRSIAETIGTIPVELFEATGYRFHAAGREDRDVRCLGDGRPFVLELIDPRLRQMDLNHLTETVNQRVAEPSECALKIAPFEWADQSEIRRLKQEPMIKRYEILVQLEHPCEPSELETLERAFTDRTIEQQTPLRVIHRRADLRRQRQVHHLRCQAETEDSLRCFIETDGGLYIKELFHGDQGRTLPNVSQFLEQQLTVRSLDVIGVIDQKS